MEEKEKSKFGTLWPIFAVVLLIATVTTIILIKMNGSTISGGGFPDPESTKSLSCTSNSFVYPFFEYDNSTKKEAVFTSTFQNDKLSNISFTYQLTYQTDEQVTESEARNHAAMNISFNKAGLSPDYFSATYAKMVSNDKVMKMTLFGSSSDITDFSAKYLLLESISDSKMTLSNVRSVYRRAGFDCKVNN